MKKNYLAILALALPILLWTVGCSQSASSDFSEEIPPAENDVSLTTSPTKETIPTLPPAVSLEANLELAHEEYAKFTGAGLLDIQTCWKESGHASQAEYFTSVGFFNDFLKFVYCVDPEVGSRLDYSKDLVKQAHDFLDSKDCGGFLAVAAKLTSNNKELKKRILKAVHFYGIPVADLLPVYSSLDPVYIKLMADAGGLLSPIAVKLGLIFPTEELSDQTNLLLQSVSLVFTAPGGSAELFSFENFSAPKDSVFPLLGIIFAFETGQGGFGSVGSDQVRFVN